MADTLMFARPWSFDVIYGPEPPIPADFKREAEHQRLHDAFPSADIDKTMTTIDEERSAQPDPTAELAASAEVRIIPAVIDPNLGMSRRISQRSASLSFPPPKGLGASSRSRGAGALAMAHRAGSMMLKRRSVWATAG